MSFMSKSNPHSQRTSDIDLPAGDEIMHISDAEEKRVLLPEKKEVHYPVFSTIISIYEHFGLDPDIFISPNLTPQHILDTGRMHVEKLTKIILNIKLSQKEIHLLQNAYEYLSEEDVPEISEYIFVFGAKTPFRPQKAVELYNRGLASKIIFSGKGPFYSNNVETEATQYADIALEAGIPNHALIIEDASITIPDNVRRTLNMMDRLQMPCSSFILVNSPYTQRRGWCSWKKHLPDSVKVHRVNCETGDQFKPTTWYTTEVGLKVILGEFPGLRNTMAFNDA